MALYIPHSILHLAQLLYVRPENFGPYYVCYTKAVGIETYKYVIFTFIHELQIKHFRNTDI